METQRTYLWRGGVILVRQVASLLLLSLMPLSLLAADHREIEHPNPDPTEKNNLHDTWLIKYQVDDFSDEVKQASLLYIPKDYRTDKAFFMRCKDYFANFSIQYIDLKKHLLDEDQQLPNASPSFAKHGYVYDDKQTLKVKTPLGNEFYNISVGGQNNYLSKLFNTHIKQQDGMLGMSLHFSFTYKEMPAFKADKNTHNTRLFFKQLTDALKHRQTMHFRLVSDMGHTHKFQLDTKRLMEFVPPEVIDYCITDRLLR